MQHSQFRKPQSEATLAAQPFSDRVTAVAIAIAATALVAVLMVTAASTSAFAQATAVGQQDDTAGVYLYSAGGDTQGFLTPPPANCAGLPSTDPTNATVGIAVDATPPTLRLLGNDEAEIIDFNLGAPGEREGGTRDTSVAAVALGLAAVDDYGNISNGEDDDANYDAETGGDITLQLHVDGEPAVIVPDGVASTGVLGTDPAQPFTNLDGAEIFIFEDAELSGMIVDLFGPDGLTAPSYSFAVADYQRDPDTIAAADDTLIAVDLDSLPGFSFPFVTYVKITDDGVVVSPNISSCPGGAFIDTSLELDAVATRTDVVVVPEPSIDIEKDTNGDQADTGPGMSIPQGDLVTWSYVITNTGNVDLINVVVTDDQEGAVCNFAAIAVGEVLGCQITGLAGVGTYENFGTVSADPVGGDTPVTDVDRSAYNGVPFATLGDFIFIDIDGDGVQGAGEVGLANAVVKLWYVNTVTAELHEFDRQTTGADGAYLFEDLVPGVEYTVEVVLPNGFRFTVADAGTDDAVDSDADPLTGLLPAVVLAAGEANLTLDAGVIPLTAAIDVEKTTNGVQSDTGPGETLAAGSDVEWVYVVTNTGTIGLTNVTLTDDQGVAITCPGGLPIAALAVGEQITCTGFDNAIEGAYVNIATATGAPADDSDPVTDSDPSAYTGVVALASIGDFVWDDADSNGVQGADEPGVEGVTVNLLVQDDDGNQTVLETTTTDASGNYLFAGLDPALTYVVQVVAPEGTVVTAADAGANDAIDSDVNATTGLTPPITLAPGEVNLTIDAGIAPAGASLGNLLWFDVDSDGVQGGDEPGIAGVTVNLHGEDENGEPGDLLAATTTDANGMYLFPSLDANTGYFVEFVIDPAYTFTGADAGADDEVDSDVAVDTGISPLTTVAAGEENLTVDAGVLPLVADIVIVKTTSAATFTAGDPVTWTYVVTNTGEVDLVDVVVDDDIEGRICEIMFLGIDASATCTKNGVAVTGNYVNTATTTGSPNTTNPDGSPIDAPTDEDDSGYEGTDVLSTPVVPSPTPTPRPTSTPAPTATARPTATPAAPILAVTGGSNGELAAVASMLMVAGAALVVVAGRRREARI